MSKFKAWDKENSRMVYPSTDDVYFELTDDGINILDMSVEPFDDVFPHLDAILMQFTGLSDKNGVDIYEGDIVEVIWDFTTFIGVVVYDQSEAGFKATNDIADYDTSFMYLTGNDSVEVIGNIYKDTELLGRRIGEE